MNINPSPGYVIVEPLEAEKKTAGGLYLTDTSERPQEGTVLAVGDETKDEKPPCKKGDVVIYKKWGGNEVKIEGKEYLFVKFEDILGLRANDIIGR